MNALKYASFSLDESENIESVTPETKTQEASPEDILNLGKPLQFDRSEKHSFNEWLKLAGFKTIKRDVEDDKQAGDR